MDPSGGTSVAEKGSKEVTILSTGHEKARVTVMLTASSDGKKMPIFVSLPRKRPIEAVVKKFGKKKWFCVGREKLDGDAFTTTYLEKVI